VPDVDSLAPGSFCWPELATTDQGAAIAFYRDLFGWDVNDQPMGPGETYSLFRLRGKDAGAAYTMRPEERKAGAPPHWNAYVKVSSADDAARRAQELGATVFAPPFDVMESGRMAVLQDPTGAVFQVWQPRKHAGIRVTNEPGALCWTELTTRDTKRAETFYTELFGWTPKHSSASAGMDYTEFSVQGQPSIGMMAMPPMMPAGMPSYWMPYFQVADVDASAARAKTLGGAQHMPPGDIPGTGRFAVLADPQGAVFAIYTPKRV
jgi:predicted enzyme related to lactoylglutathione lyase